VGALSTIIDLIVYNLLLRAGVHIYIAGAIGFFAGFTNGYFFNSRYVFYRASTERYVKYFLVSLGGLLITEMLLHELHLVLGMGQNPAKLVAVVVVFVWNYLLSKFWAFN
jgi:putative flippase GtrA